MLTLLPSCIHSLSTLTFLSLAYTKLIITLGPFHFSLSPDLHMASFFTSFRPEHKVHFLRELSVNCLSVLWRRKWQPTPVFAWKIPWTEEPGRLQSMGLQRARHNWVSSLSFWTHTWCVLAYSTCLCALPETQERRGCLHAVSTWSRAGQGFPSPNPTPVALALLAAGHKRWAHGGKHKIKINK